MSRSLATHRPATGRGDVPAGEPEPAVEAGVAAAVDELTRPPGTDRGGRLAAMALGLGVSDQPRRCRIELLAVTAGFEAEPLEEALRTLRDRGLDPVVAAPASRLLEAAVAACAAVRRTPEDWREQVEGLLGQAEVFDQPGTYRAGVLDTLAALGFERPGRGA